MTKKYSVPRVLIGIALLIGAAVLSFQYFQSNDPIEQVLTPLEYLPIEAEEGQEPKECVPIPEEPDQPGTQGMKIWSGSTLRAFKHNGETFCLPVGWEPVGVQREGKGWIFFSPTQGGVIVRSDAFESRVDRYENTPFEVNVVWPKAMPAKFRAANDALIERAFVNVGRLYPRFPENLTKSVTVLISGGIAGNTRSPTTRIYPEPGYNLVTLVRFPDQARAEELFVHAVAHLYNRHRPYFWFDEEQPPFPVPPKDWEELVATWTETAFLSRHDWRMKRLEYLMNVHAAVQTDDFARIVAAPFDKREEFDRIRPDVIVREGSPGIDYQYGHYILAPLSMVGIQGLLMHLAEAGTIEEISVETLLAEVHNDQYSSFFHALEELLPSEEVDRVHGWMHDGQRIPDELLLAAAEHYRLLNEQ